MRFNVLRQAKQPYKYTNKDKNPRETTVLWQSFRVFAVTQSCSGLYEERFPARDACKYLAFETRNIESEVCYLKYAVSFFSN